MASAATQAVKTQADSLGLKFEQSLTWFQDQQELLRDSAEALAKEGHAEGVDHLRKNLEELLDAQQKVVCHEAALKQLRARYTEAAAVVTDFKAELQQLAAEAALSMAAKLKQTREETLKEFDKATWDPLHPGQPFPGDEDEDVVMNSTQSVAPNMKCPLTMKDIFALAEPVEDHKGVVYDKTAIEEYIKKNGKGKGSVTCPNAGAQHTVSLKDLKPAKRVIRQAKQNKKGGASQTQASRAEVVIDDE